MNLWIYEFGKFKEDIFGVCMLYAQKQFIKNKEFVIILNDTLETMDPSSIGSM